MPAARVRPSAADLSARRRRRYAGWLALAILAGLPDELQHEHLWRTPRLGVALTQAPSAREDREGGARAVALRLPLSPTIRCWREARPLEAQAQDLATLETLAAAIVAEPAAAPVGQPVFAAHVGAIRPAFGGGSAGGGFVTATAGPTPLVTPPMEPDPIVTTPPDPPPVVAPPSPEDVPADPAVAPGPPTPIPVVEPTGVVAQPPAVVVSPPETPPITVPATPPVRPEPPPVVGPPIAPQAGAVPEPATWLVMILGFGLAGAGLRRRRPAAQ